ncbi:hypothetical protein FJTKL_10870 [Diaporthe vaccinii]|uniref:Uncharacterized protein n=1 Tax=Diaporthe vaccinii TaxID=105482 RepID=A0ABR4FC46_9PEZI
MASSGIIYHTMFKTALPLSRKCSSQRQSRGARTFTPIVPPMEAPVFAQARLADSAFSKVADAEGMDAFGAEMIKRGLEHFWIDVNRQQLFSARS